MKVLSIDIGIKNLAFCLFEKPENAEHFKISKWDIVNISEKVSLKCLFTVDKGIVCGKPAKFQKDNKCFCLKHSKKLTSLQIPTSELKSTFINKQKIQKLFEIADKHSIKYTKPIKKDGLISLINEHIYNNCLEAISNTNASKVDLITIGANIKDKFNVLFSNEDMIDHVIIENQISPIANRMKTIQGMVVQYFIMSDVGVGNIEFISASNKLKDCNISDKIKYSDRKKLGIAKCLETITNGHQFNDKVDYFKSHSKKDDLSDSFLQGLWFINDRQI